MNFHLGNTAIMCHQRGVGYEETVITQEELDKIIDTALHQIAELVRGEKKEMLPMTTDYRYGKATKNGIWWWNICCDHIADMIEKECEL